MEQLGLSEEKDHLHFRRETGSDLGEVVPLHRKVKHVEIQVIIDNESDPISSTEEGVHMSEWAVHMENYTRESLDFEKLCHAGHGLSLLVTATDEQGRSHSVIFDTGCSEKLFNHNAECLCLAHVDVDAIVLSHWHGDHSGGLIAAATHVGKAREEAGKAPTVVDLPPRRPHRRSAPGGVSMATGPAPAALAALPGVSLDLREDAHTLCDGVFYVSGEIPRLTKFEKGLPGHFSQWEEGGKFEEDPLILEERYLYVEVEGAGLVVVTGCAHAGAVNTLRDAARASGCPRVAALAGGLHLAGKQTEPIIQETICALEQLDPTLVIPGHCTGWRAKHDLADIFGEQRFLPSRAGHRYHISAELCALARTAAEEEGKQQKEVTAASPKSKRMKPCRSNPSTKKSMSLEDLLEKEVDHVVIK